MAHVICLVVLFTLVIIKSVEGNANLCKGKEYGEPCGDDGEYKSCVCANENIVKIENAGGGIIFGGYGQLVCKDIKCFSMSRRHLKPKNGKYKTCFAHSDCGRSYMCTNNGQTAKPGYCCHSENGKQAKLVRTPDDDDEGK